MLIMLRPELDTLLVLRLPMRDGDLSIKGWKHTVAKLDDLAGRSL